MDHDVRVFSQRPSPPRRQPSISKLHETFWRPRFRAVFVETEKPHFQADSRSSSSWRMERKCLESSRNPVFFQTPILRQTNSVPRGENDPWLPSLVGHQKMNEGVSETLLILKNTESECWHAISFPVIWISIIIRLSTINRREQIP